MYEVMERIETNFICFDYGRQVLIENGDIYPERGAAIASIFCIFGSLSEEFMNNL